MNLRISYFLIIIFLTSCGSSSKTPQQKEVNQELDKNKNLRIVNEDSIQQNITNLDNIKTKKQLTIRDLIAEEKWTIDSFIKKSKNNQLISLKTHMKWVIQKWKNVPNPIIATYLGNDFGDYHHINFRDTAGIEYDFGQASNSYGDYQLYDSTGHYNDNPKYLGKQFKIFWDWKLSIFQCCEGEYNLAEAYLPSIMKLELINK